MIDRGLDRWIDSHSVNCIKCGDLVDERDCIHNPDEDEAGDICPRCYIEKEEV